MLTRISLPIEIMVASPEYTENTIALFREAADANLATPGRVGNVIDIGPQSGDDVMLTGDLHGHRRNFNLIRRIAALETLPRAAPGACKRSVTADRPTRRMAGACPTPSWRTSPD